MSFELLYITGSFELLHRNSTVCPQECRRSRNEINCRDQNSVIEFTVRMFLLRFRNRARTYPDKLVFIRLHTGLPAKSLSGLVSRGCRCNKWSAVLFRFSFRGFVDIPTRWHFLRRRLEIEATAALLAGHVARRQKLPDRERDTREGKTTSRCVTCAAGGYIFREKPRRLRAEESYSAGGLCYFEKYR